MSNKMIRMVKFECDEIFCGECEHRTYSSQADCICQVDGGFLESKDVAEEDWRLLRTDECLEEALDNTSMKTVKNRMAERVLGKINDSNRGSSSQ